MPYVVGLTGGIGSGKSAAAERFARLGAAVVDTDAISRELTRPGGAAIAELQRLFGDEVIGSDGALDRAKMRVLAFRDPGARARLEQLLHPLIRQESARRIAAAHGPYVVLVVPLLVESRDYRDRVSRVAVVDCPPELQIERVRRRSGLSREEVQRILDVQASREARLAAADDVIDNAGPLDALHKRVDLLHARYVQLAQAAS